MSSRRVANSRRLVDADVPVVSRSKCNGTGDDSVYMLLALVVEKILGEVKNFETFMMKCMDWRVVLLLCHSKRKSKCTKFKLQL